MVHLHPRHRAFSWQNQNFRAERRGMRPALEVAPYQVSGCLIQRSYSLAMKFQGPHGCECPEPGPGKAGQGQLLRPGFLLPALSVPTLPRRLSPPDPSGLSRVRNCLQQEPIVHWPECTCSALSQPGESALGRPWGNHPTSS